MKDYENATYEIFGYRRYTVIQWIDGDSLFLSGDSEKIFLEEYMTAAEVWDTDHMERLFGIGSEYHGIADEVIE
jgi:hypothetical protein|tara:strand:- start:877 stop:1098 length:222 start_codon:yes stop_codon:yes gene_type:complete